MENLLIMSTVFSMRFITQVLIFQPTARKTQFRKLICIINGDWGKAGCTVMAMLTYRTQIDAQTCFLYQSRSGSWEHKKGNNHL